MSDRRIVLGMPGYGKQSHAAGRALWRACADMDAVDVRVANGSLLCSNFNQLWCHGINLVHEGKQVDYFAMLHDDVGAPDGWLDTLIDEMEAKGLDVLGVVVPIKDNRGMTSLALDGGDQWMPHARLSMHDVYQLPETFTSDDLDHRLLLNTGCWVCRFDIEWAKRVRFEINDRIVFNRSCNRYQAQTEPEDWHFSRQLHEIGSGPTSHLKPLRIGATRKVPVVHFGDVFYESDHPWGTQVFDVEAVETSPVPGAFPLDVHGWLTAEEGRALSELAHSKRVLEIGSYCGLSTICLARTASHVTAVDYFDGRATPQQANTLERFKDNLMRYGVANKVVACSPEEFAELGFDGYDLVFIDGAHDYDSVAADIETAKRVLAPGGLIAFHDYRQAGEENDNRDPGVRQAVDELLADGAELISRHATVAVVRPPAPIPLEV